ncbi:Sybindin-like protein [Durotheca rogersii]|uniref:Sybindin-like protein n=1 Tax=Durotheca rogersii TaxID=419775 RepID=UPI00221EBAF6|nr:Sybindin-like protein [Durotheca rogersii]KAI5865026.1 Sybindin-like protein [Durotheca rogersii]
MGVLALIVINKAGGLIYNRTFGDGLNQLNTNDYLVLAGTFHGVHAITARLNPRKELLQAQHQQAVAAAAAAAASASSASAAAAGGGSGASASGGGAAAGVPMRPDPPSGLEVLESENFRLQCFTTLTGTKFLLFTDTLQANVDVAMRRVYDLYADYVMKNPFYQLEMPVRCENFDRKLNSYIREINSSR